MRDTIDVAEENVSGNALACVAWRFWLGKLSNKGGRGQRNREEIGAGAAALPLVLARFAREFFVATPLLRPARQNRHATQARNTCVS